ncbi:MAG: hypothetical protein ACOWWH_07365 [Eubacteriaceae bacterium]
MNNFSDDQSAYNSSDENISISKNNINTKNLISTFFLLVTVTFISIYLISKGIPKYFCIPAIIILIILFITELVYITFFMCYSIKENTVTDKPKYPVKINSKEVLKDYIPGIWRYGSRSISYAPINSQKSNSPENSLIITNLNIWAVTVPIGAKIASNSNASKWQWLNMHKEIKNILERIIDSMPLEEMLNSCIPCNIIPINSVKNFDTSDISNAITLITYDNNIYTYSIRSKDDYEKAKLLLINLLPSTQTNQY